MMYISAYDPESGKKWVCEGEGKHEEHEEIVKV
jgi:hypothetical protein